MYSLNYNLRELSGVQSFPPIGFAPKTFRNKINFFKYNQLPPIKEEEGNSSQSEIELKNIPSYSPLPNVDSYENGFTANHTNSNTGNRKKKLSRERRTKNEDSFSNFPPVVNVNCLMNLEMKQQQPIWKTSFGKRLINGKPRILETMSLPTIKKGKKTNEKLMENQRSKSADSSCRSFFSGKNVHTGLDDKMAQSKKTKAKPWRVQKKSQKSEGKKSKEQKPSEASDEHHEGSSKTDSKETPASSAPTRSESLTDSRTTSRTTKNQNFLSHCVQTILGGKTVQSSCDFCDDIFTSVEELNSHLEKHEREKEVCVLCNKVFYTPKEFAQHLLTHESVDKFSCKKCKKYFPSLRKYKIHCKEVHPKSVELTKTEKNCSIDSMKTWTSKYECKRCQAELSSEEDFRLHKRNHIRLDLMGAYLLSSKRI